MIAFIEGPLSHIEPTFVIININGVGYQIKISLHTYSKIKDLEKVKLQTHLQVKEDSHTLYGFFDIREKNLFIHLISISGVGPSTGIMITSSLSVDEITSAIVNGDVNTIQRIKGIGLKTAQRIIIELKDKLNKDGSGIESFNILSGANNTIRNEALTALITLGISKNIAEKSVDSILKTNPNAITLEELIKQALKRA